MAQVRNLLNHVCVEEAAARRICHRKRGVHSILKGQVCLVVSDDNGGSKNYCTLCALDILKKAHATVAELANALGLPSPNG